MILIKVKYDAYNRQFVLVDREMARSLEDGEIYVLVADVSVQSLTLAHEEKAETAAVEVERVLA
jgi:hypothetical protein